jgi:hypothetical protein
VFLGFPRRAAAFVVTIAACRIFLPRRRDPLRIPFANALATQKELLLRAALL